MGTKVDAYIARDPNGICRVMVKRAKFKHWHIIGFHFESDQAFKRALAAGTVVWLPKIIEPPTLFEK